MRVIIVDDNDVFRSTLKSLVDRTPGFKVVAEAVCGITGVQTVRDNEADLVLLDLSLPKLSGIEVLKEIRKFSSIKILVLTIYSDKDVIKEAMNRGADGICLKEHGRSVLVDAMVKTAQGERPIFTDYYRPDAVLSKE